MTAPAPSGARPRGPLIELAALFLRLGFTAFGGPAAHIAMFENEVVRRRKWISHEQFLDLLGVTNLIPGPNSTEMVIHIGQLRAGTLGMIVAGTCFVLPAALIVGALAWLYVRFGALPQAESLLYGVKPAVLAIILQALWALGRKAVTSRLLGCAAAAAAAASLLGLNEVLVLLAAGVATGLLHAIRDGLRKHARGLAAIGAVTAFVAGMMGAAALAQGAESESHAFSLHALFLFFLKVGSVLYGSGYVLLAFLQGDLVNKWHWITEAQLLDAVAVGQVTPGPLFTAATFIGFMLAGIAGAAVATLGIFLPSFIFVALSGPIIPKLRKSTLAGRFLDGVNAASLALMAVVTARLGIGGVTDGFTLLLAVASAVLLFRYRVNATWLVLGGAVLGLAKSQIVGL